MNADREPVPIVIISIDLQQFASDVSGWDLEQIINPEALVEMLEALHKAINELRELIAAGVSDLVRLNDNYNEIVAAYHRASEMYHTLPKARAKRHKTG
jgi:ABC-type nitrate/sulfonate/bicarbonate transport system substrate-binding protein